MADFAVMFLAEKVETPASSNVSRFWYHRDDHELFVEFQGGSIYVYREVPAEVVEDFVDAPSKGQFVHQRLRDKFAYDRLT